LRTINGDFANAYRQATPQTRPTLRVYDAGTGPFAADGQKLKNEYVWHLSATLAHQYAVLG